MMMFLIPQLWAAQPQDLSNSMSIPSTDIISQSITGDSSATAVQSSLGVISPTDGADMGQLHTGTVGVHPEPGTDLGGYGEAGDRTTYTIQLQVPASANSMMFDFYFLSAEYPEYVGTEYNDKFEANITGTAYSGNAATDSMGNLVDVNSAFFTVVQSSDLQGTGFENGVGGGTGWLTMMVPVDPSDIVTISFTIYDVGDGSYDSTVMLDNFNWSSSDIDIPSIITPIVVDYLSPKRSELEGGGTISVFGVDFNGTCKVFFDGIESPQTTFVDSTVLHAEVPPHEAGIVDVTVVCDGVEGILNNSFTYFENTDGSIPPEIDSLDPYQIPANGGDEISLAGSGFENGAVVEVDGVAVQTTFISTMQLMFLAPEHEEGFADVVVTNPDGLFDEYSGGLYYTPVIEEPEAEVTEPASEDTGEEDTASEEESSAPKDAGTACAHVRKNDGVVLALMLLLVAGRRRK